MKRRMFLVAGVFAAFGLETYFGFLRTIDRAITAAFNPDPRNIWDRGE